MTFTKLDDKTVVVDGDIAMIQLANVIVTVDACSLPILEEYRWRYREREFRKSEHEVFVPDGKHITKRGSGTWVLMPRLLLGLGLDTTRIAHVKNRDGTDMRIANLIATSRSNANRHLVGNGTDIGSIAWIPRHEWWQVYAVLGNRKQYVGVFKDLEEAIAAKSVAMKELAKELKLDISRLSRMSG